MQTLLLYLLIMALVVGIVFALAWFVFGRGEELPPLDDATTLTRLPEYGVVGDDVRGLTFALTMRGYKQAEVDWALDRLASEIDALHAVVDRLHREGIAANSGDTDIERVVSPAPDAGPAPTNHT